MNQQNTAGILSTDYAAIGGDAARAMVAGKILGARAHKITPFTELSEALAELRTVRADLLDLTARLAGKGNEPSNSTVKRPVSGLIGEVQEAARSIRSMADDMRGEIDRVRASI